MNIILVGMQGVGKTTYGKALAKLTERDFFDTDQWIEQAYATLYSQEIPYQEIYRRLGEKQFRQWEQQAVVHSASLQQSIIATGGGVLIDLINRSVLRASGRIVYLYESQQTFLQRQTTPKPNFTHNGVPYLSWHDYYVQRHGFYARYCDSKIISSDNLWSQMNMSAFSQIVSETS